MQISNLLLWGFAATLILTVLMSASRPLGLTRMDLPFMLGTLYLKPQQRILAWFLSSPGYGLAFCFKL